jgi:hypothetical protein
VLAGDGSTVLQRIGNSTFFASGGSMATRRSSRKTSVMVAGSSRFSGYG